MHDHERVNLRQMATRLSPAQEAALRLLIEHGSYAAVGRALGEAHRQRVWRAINARRCALVAFDVSSDYAAVYLLGARDGFRLGTALAVAGTTKRADEREVA